MKIDKRFIINVGELTEKAYLPTPRRKRKISILVSHGEWLPVIDGDTGKVVMI